ncbi:hypothetical protein, conserved in T. vivax, partial [Trypanosoma vivax Y486]
MDSKCFCLLLLFSAVVWCDVATSANHCKSPRHPSNEVVCATKDVLLGWLHVTKRPALRAEAVMKNVSEIMQRARDMRSRAENEAIKYEKLRASLVSSGTNEQLTIINQSIAAVSEAITQINESEQRANEATKEAEESIKSSAYCFSAIMRVAHYLWYVSSDGTWNYTSVKAIFDAHSSVGCEEKYNIMKTLNNTGNIDTMDLTEWKNKTLQVLNKTYNGIKLNTKKYHWSVFSEGKVEEVKKQVVDAVDRLEVAVQSFESYRTAVNSARKKLENASHQVGETKNSLLAAANGKVFCEVVSQSSSSNKGLREAGKKLTDETQGAANAVTYSERVRAEVTIADELVKEVVMWLKG